MDSQPENDHDIIHEGAVYALIALCYVEDSSIRRCCATSFYHLSSREVNREPLLNMGVTTGVVTLAMQARKWFVSTSPPNPSQYPLLSPAGRWRRCVP